MPRRLSACFACFLVFSFLAILAAPAPVRATATTYLFTAEAHPVNFVSNPSAVQWSTFSFQYTDLDGNGKVSLNEIDMSTFNGVTEKDASGTSLFSSSTIYGVPVPPANPPDVNQLTVGSGTGSGGQSIPPQLCYAWNFAPGDHGSDVGMAGVMLFTESQVPVPVPPSVFLLGSGLIGLAWARRKKLLG